MRFFRACSHGNLLPLIASMVAAALVTACAPLMQATKPDDMRHLRVEIADFYYPAASGEESRALLPALLDGASVEGRYSRYVERHKLKLFSCMIGVTCFPFPHIGTDVDTIDMIVKSSDVRTSVDAESGVVRLDFSLPRESASTDSTLVVVRLPLAALWRAPSVKSYVDARLDRVARERFIEPRSGADETMDLELSIDLDAAQVPGFPPWCAESASIHMPQSYYYDGLISYRVFEQLHGEMTPRPQQGCAPADTDEAGHLSSALKQSDNERFHQFHDR